ncbi:Uncharacterised protein [Mycobacteroides abscessus subsp. abscessus]|nr:Uncharacterised protein [Mycobacteroides abscessus subsp. abscessus]SLF24886.1 Uncharacterised protein [Mycobacteroides abscessus subsp. abscessus]
MGLAAGGGRRGQALARCRVHGITQNLAAIDQSGFGVDAAGDLLGSGISLGLERLTALLPLGDILFDLALNVSDMFAVAGYRLIALTLGRVIFHVVLLVDRHPSVLVL